jgi:hypothetical protein
MLTSSSNRGGRAINVSISPINQYVRRIYLRRIEPRPILNHYPQHTLRKVTTETPKVGSRVEAHLDFWVKENSR